ncbi:unnamed protein product [Lactuca virosa]|uniref:Filament-like plant protein 3 n=1 Tax=Lactuca virosa TaxID=75947 RepID=A0AAU9MLU8_9ASTR|nr:unnamed protein product [Lactuca virosa]
MDRRSWLWRRRSSEKSPGETESSGGSVSSHSERFFDDQIYSNQSSLSPEVTSKSEVPQEELEGGVKTLSQKLSAALVNISIKEDLVKQHSKVAEEAVEGWEKAENEVLGLRQQIEVLTLRNSTLEDRVCQLDGALKECLRQLRQTREEKDKKITEIIEKKTSEWQITKSQLENQLAEFRSIKKGDPFLIQKLEKENSAMKLELASMAEELEIRLIERELSNQAAESASKLHLESVRKVTKLESECRKLNTALRKALVANDRSLSVVENDRNAPSIEINLMDDFLEMEKLVGLPKVDPRDSVQTIDQTSEIKEILKRVETEKKNLEIKLKEREKALEKSRNQLKEAELKLREMEASLVSSNDARETTEKELESTKGIVEVLHERVKRSESEVVELKSQMESRLGDAYAKKNEAESKFKKLEAELESLIPKVESFETKVEKERALSGKMEAKCQELEMEISRLQLENEYTGNIRTLELESEVAELKSQLDTVRRERREAESRIEDAYTKKNKAESQIETLKAELESLIPKVGSLEAEVGKERALSGKMETKCRELEGEILRLQHQNQYPKAAIQNTQLRVKQDTELAMAGTKFAECQKTIASLSHQLKTLATLEDFLII